jgi:hypothetical protein
MSRRAAVLAIVLLVEALAGCKRLGTGAREQFSKQYACPLERVEVIARGDLRYGDLIPTGAEAEPPDEVKRDPGRLAKWKQDRADEVKERRSTLDAIDVYQVRGCVHDTLYGCWHPGNSEGNAQSDEVSCSEPRPGAAMK